MNRRGFLAGILAAGVAPAFAGSGVLMPVRKLWTASLPILWGDGIHDDAPALQALFNGESIDNKVGGIAQHRAGEVSLGGGIYRLSKTVNVGDGVQASFLGGVFEAADEFKGDTLLNFEPGSRATMYSTVMDVRGRAQFAMSFLQKPDPAAPVIRSTFPPRVFGGYRGRS